MAAERALVAVAAVPAALAPAVLLAAAMAGLLAAVHFVALEAELVSAQISELSVAQADQLAGGLADVLPGAAVPVCVQAAALTGVLTDVLAVLPAAEMSVALAVAPLLSASDGTHLYSDLTQAVPRVMRKVPRQAYSNFPESDCPGYDHVG